MQRSSASQRGLAIATGAIIIAATSHAVVTITHQTGAHAALTYVLAGGLFVGSCIVGAAWGETRHALAIALAVTLLALEAGNAGLSVDAIVTKRDRDGAAHREATAAYQHALGEMSKAQTAFDAANRAVVAQSALKDCKANCRALLQSQVDAAKHDLDNSRAIYGANPAPSASGSPLADRIGVPAWAVDVALALLLAIGGNGLAALLVAYGAHTAHSFPDPDTLTPAELDEARRILRPATNVRTAQRPANSPASPDNSPNSPAANAITAYILTEIALGRSIPSQQGVAERFGAPKSTVSDLLADLELSGMISRHREGRRMVITAPQ